MSLRSYNQKIQKYVHNIKNTQHFQNKMASKGKSHGVWPPFAHLHLFLGNCTEVFFSYLPVYYTRLPFVLALTGLWFRVSGKFREKASILHKMAKNRCQEDGDKANGAPGHTGELSETCTCVYIRTARRSPNNPGRLGLKILLLLPPSLPSSVHFFSFLLP